MPERRSFQKSLELCQRLGGEMVLPDSEADTKELERIFVPYEDKCGQGRLWIGIWDFPDEGNFTNVNTGEEVSLSHLMNQYSEEKGLLSPLRSYALKQTFSFVIYCGETIKKNKSRNLANLGIKLF